MQGVTDNRRANFRRLVEKLGGPRFASLKLDMNESQVSQLISANIRKAMGNRLARKIETVAGLPVGSLDMATSADGRIMRPVPVIDARDLENPEFMSTGIPDEGDERRQVIWDNSNPYRATGPLVAVYVPNDALAGTANEGDLAIFDCWPIVRGAAHRIRIGSVVLIAHEGDLALRVIRQSGRGGYEFIAASKLYAPIYSKDAKIVLGVLCEVRWINPRIVTPM